jgi:hypothetical protein
MLDGMLLRSVLMFCFLIVLHLLSSALLNWSWKRVFIQSNSTPLNLLYKTLGNNYEVRFKKQFKIKKCYLGHIYWCFLPYDLFYCMIYRIKIFYSSNVLQKDTLMCLSGTNHVFVVRISAKRAAQIWTEFLCKRFQMLSIKRHQMKKNSHQ